MAGDAVTIAPVSSQIPCKQGIFQGIPEIPPLKVPPIGEKRLCCSDFLRNSLRRRRLYLWRQAYEDRALATYCMSAFGRLFRTRGSRRAILC
jgi:hypothetical protein